MSAPAWIDAIVRDFGRAAGLDDFALNERGAAALSFETGLELRLEHAYDSLVVAVTVPSPATPDAARRILHSAHPAARHGFKLRAGYLPKTSRAVFAARLADREVTLPALNTAFNALWRIALDFGGAP
ncbi:MAG: CesT family type III secretion system chaperone [Kiritimatiellae bacterium]|jgi:type III secretion system chaperone SycN|nr:CesT family type III secretion system chaperone [Kiritimatiellia bacterium]